MKKSRSDEDTEEDSDERTSTSLSSEVLDQIEGGKLNKQTDSEVSSTETSTSTSSESESESEPETNDRKGKGSGVVKKELKKPVESPEALKKKVLKLPTQQPVTNSLKKDLQRTRVVRKVVEENLPPKSTVVDKKKEVPKMTLRPVKKALTKKKTSDEIMKGDKPNEVTSVLFGGPKTVIGGVKENKEPIAQNKKGPIVKKKGLEGSSSSKVLPKTSEAKDEKAVKKTTGSTQKKKVADGVPGRRLAVKKTENPPRQQRPAATNKTDGRSEPIGRTVQRKAETQNRALPRKLESQAKGPQSRTAFTMSGPKQIGQQVRSIAKERLIGQSDQA